ncbi:MAG: amino acid permease, partial [Thiotrichales bacterium]|nr:amino acid permease [Thiotrichales bacterium]
IYVLIGKVALNAGYYAPISFLISSLLAGFTAFSYAELASRYPLSAVEAVYVQKGFGLRHLSLLVGLLIITTGVVSSATIARGFVGYLDVFINLPDGLVITGLLIFLGAFAVWGITQSVGVAAALTLVGVLGLFFIIAVALPAFSTLPERVPQFTPPFETSIWLGIFSGAFLAFYAYVGFEDMVNVAEEVKSPEKNLPIAIILSLILVTILYVLIATVSLLVLTDQELAVSSAPLASVYERMTGSQPLMISLISMLAVVNGALVQIIMASRVCYGLSRQGWLPEFLGIVSARTRTPISATVLITALIIIMALWLPIETLARLTSYFLLVIFALVNAALIRIKNRNIEEAGAFIIPVFIPWAGLLGCLFFLLLQTYVGLSQH